MALLLDLAPTVEARLQTLAHARDMSVSEFVTMLLRQWEEHEAEPKAKNDPEFLINEAVRELGENQIKYRELAVQAITHKNALQAEVQKLERFIAEMDRKAALALQSGNRELAKKFFKEKAPHEQTLQSARINLAAATEAAEKVKQAIHKSEEHIRARTSEALTLKTARKQSQIIEKVNQMLNHFSSTPSTVFEWSPEWEQAFEEWARKQSTQAAPDATQETTSSEPTPENQPDEG